MRTCGEWLSSSAHSNPKYHALILNMKTGTRDLLVYRILYTDFLMVFFFAYSHYITTKSFTFFLTLSFCTSDTRTLQAKVSLKKQEHVQSPDSQQEMLC